MANLSLENSGGVIVDCIRWEIQYVVYRISSWMGLKESSIPVI